MKFMNYKIWINPKLKAYSFLMRLGEPDFHMNGFSSVCCIGLEGYFLSFRFKIETPSLLSNEQERCAHKSNEKR